MSISGMEYSEGSLTNSATDADARSFESKTHIDMQSTIFDNNLQTEQIPELKTLIFDSIFTEKNLRKNNYPLIFHLPSQRKNFRQIMKFTSRVNSSNAFG
jgi:hypothetical protein